MTSLIRGSTNYKCMSLLVREVLGKRLRRYLSSSICNYSQSEAYFQHQYYTLQECEVDSGVANDFLNRLDVLSQAGPVVDVQSFVGLETTADSLLREIHKNCTFFDLEAIGIDESDVLVLIFLHS